MQKRKIVFRADGGNLIGMGHFTRTLALAEMLSDQFECIFAIQNPSPVQIEEIERVCHSFIDLPLGKSHFNNFLDTLRGDEIVVLDNYFFDTEYQFSIKLKGCKLVCIDDLHDKFFKSDLIINHSPGIDVNDYSTNKKTKILLGLDYVLLRSPFLKKAKLKNNNIKNNTVFINFGGEDRLNITLRVIKDMVKSKPNLNAKIVLGYSNKNTDSIIDFISKTESKIEVFTNRNASQMAEIICSCDFAVVPSSTVLFEVIACKIPFITGAYVDNQNLIAKSLNNNVFGIVLQDIINDNIPWDKIIKFEVNSKEVLIDGNSDIRLIKMFKEL